MGRQGDRQGEGSTLGRVTNGVDESAPFCDRRRNKDSLRDPTNGVVDGLSYVHPAPDGIGCVNPEFCSSAIACRM